MNDNLAMNDNIQIFACDHRKNVQWDLPYIRLGNSQSDAVVSIKDDAEIMPYHRLLSEGAQIWWVYKHYKELGNPDFVGFFNVNVAVVTLQLVGFPLTVPPFSV